MEIDQRTEKFLNTLTPDAREKFKPFILEVKKELESLGLEFVAICGTRTFAEQNALYAQGRTKKGPIVTKAKGGYSWHNFGIALDFGIFRKGAYLDDSEPRTAEKAHAIAGKIATKHGIEWGGNWQSFKDYPHFQIATGKSMKEMREEYLKG
jgi:peptidoglycan L-alanyl-D-glutamate endopeptidase CwlK